ncbi:E3 ubiquitin ligase rnf-5-like [Galendromus occidentalis]|uniref:RING-type E3 ubiquitin transferase n=1 Tax=Galendromus occidentalis TaxID=34638 RepID=A0AAJ7L880_9ACAR|nr:E3 ubiquitin ligase rnf-5-like [Galendromus occidentalis]
MQNEGCTSCGDNRHTSGSVQVQPIREVPYQAVPEEQEEQAGGEQEEVVAQGQDLQAEIEPQVNEIGGEEPVRAQPESTRWRCTVCMDEARNAVVTTCGHLSCWTCLCRWVAEGTAGECCPVCRSEIRLERSIPIFGTETDEDVEGEDMPPRPRALYVPRDERRRLY